MSLLGALSSFPFLIHTPPPPASCFCFGATGTSSSHHGSKWLAGLSWRPGGRLVALDRGTYVEGGRGGLCALGGMEGPTEL